jgi:hypothetical protein
MDEDDKQQRQE